MTKNDICKKIDSVSIALESKLEPLFKNLPHLPQKVINFFVVLYKWCTILAAVILPLSVVFSLLGITSLGVIGIVSTVLASIFYLLSGLGYGLAIKPLKENKKEGWYYLLFAQFVYMLGGVCAILVSVGTGIGAVISGLIGFYILFEIRKEYK